jgi:hypothetical protein
MAVKYLDDGESDGTVLGQASTAKIGFYGATPAARRTGTFTVVSTTAATTTTPWGYSTSTQADAIVTRLNEVINVLITSGLRGAS